MSGYEPYVPNERIVDRAVALWMAMLSNPKYDNLGENSPESPESIRVNKFSSLLAHALPKNNNSEVLPRFGEELRKILIGPFTWESEWQGEKKIYTQTVRHLEVDYHPDVALRTAAERAGLDMEFPWKTSMTLSEDHLSVAYGYGSPYLYHYPLMNGEWFVTTLAGEDIWKIVMLIEAGVLNPGLEVIHHPAAKASA